MDRKKTYQLIIAILLVVLLLMIILYSVGTISHDVVVILGLGIICVCGLLYHLNSSAPKTKEDRDDEKRELALKKTKVPRSREGTIFEVITALILIGSLVIGVATHTMELRDCIWNGYAFCFIGAIAGLILAYHPLFAWSPSSCHITNVEQFKLLIRKHRVFAVESALMALILSISPTRSHLLIAILICLFIAWLGTDFLFSFLLNKNK